MPYIGKTTDGFGVRNRFVYLASSGDTSVSGADANGATLTFTDGAYVDVFLNGVLLKPTTDYNTSTANTIAGLSALNTNDEVTVVVYDVFTVADMVSATSGGTFSGAVTVNNTLDMNGTELILDADGDSSIHSSTDDQIDIKVGNVDKIIVTGNGDISLGGNTPNTYSGYTAITVGGSASTAGTTIDFEDSDGNRDFQVYARSEGLYLSNNDVIIETGDIVFAGSGKGINLGVTSNTDSNTLDDYEEGTYDVAVACGTSGSITIRSDYNEGYYNKVGTLVHAQGYIVVSGVSSPSGYISIGLPFAVANTSSEGGDWSTASVTVQGSAKNVNQMNATIIAGGSQSILVYASDATTLQADSAEAIAADDSIYFSCTYRSA
jgi:hypothetical protein